MAQETGPVEISTDYLVIGTGLAGLIFALRAAKTGTVAVVTKHSAEESNTRYAQGGIASVLDKEDSFDLHVTDTMRAGGGLNHPEAVSVLVHSGPEAIKNLISYGAAFTARNGAAGGAIGELSLGVEGGHSKRRIVHANDLTGLEIERTLITAARAEKNIKIFERHIAVNLISRAKLSQGKIPPRSADDRIAGAYVLDIESGKVATFKSKITLLATGGCGKTYLYTSNPDIATGDGIAMAYRVGAKIANMEFMQFHPTCLYHPSAKSFLISEAVRGEGGILRLRDGSTFMEKYHPMGCLAPRDIVARTIDLEMKKNGDDFVYLDTRHIEGYRLRERFPNIYATCKTFGFDMAKDMIPVVPAAHYMCGGVVTDLEGRSSIAGLYAAGETAHTGVHGANRLASNSLLEALVFSGRAAESAAKELESLGSAPELSIAPWSAGRAGDPDDIVVVSHNWDEIRMTMWNYVGIVRSDKRLTRALRRIQIIREEIRDYYWNYVITKDLVELRNLALVAELIVRCAMTRKESRGLHYNIDYPETDDQNWKKDTLLERKFG